MVTGKIIRILFLLLCGAAAAYIYIYIPNNIEAACGLLGALVVFWIFHLIARNAKKRKKRKFVNKANKYKAKILAKDFVGKNTMVIQLQITKSNVTYITNYIEQNPSSNQRGRFIIGHDVNVFINPQNKHDIFISEARSSSSNRRSRRFNGWVVFWIVVSFGPAIIPFIISLFNTSDRVFKDMEYISTATGKDYVWELRYKMPKKIYIRVFDPANGNKVKSIKEVKNEELANYMRFDFSKQENKVVLVGYGATPILDMYNETTFEKISGIEQLIEQDSRMSTGIADMQKRSTSHDFGSYDVVDITTNDGNKLYYNISTNKLYKDYKKLNNDLYQKDIQVMKDNLVAFVLSRVEDNNYQKHLYTITAKSNKYIDKLLNEVGSENFYISSFERNKRYNCKRCNLKQLTTEPFLESHMLYYDTEIAVIGSLLSLEQNADEEISCIDKTGKVIFHIAEQEYPNHEDMKEDHFYPRQRDELKITKVNNKIVFLFHNYGALCYDLTTGKQLWKWVN